MTEHRDTDLASALTHTADGLEALVVDTLGELVQRHLPQWRVPGFFAGHPVEPDKGTHSGAIGYIHKKHACEHRDG